MSYVENDKGEKNTESEQKKESLLSAIFSEEAEIEEPEDIINADKDQQRKELFKKTYSALLAMYPDTTAKKKRKKKDEIQKGLQKEIQVKGENIPETVKVSVKQREKNDNDGREL